MTAAGFLLAMSVVLLVAARRGRRVADGSPRCRACGYDLRGGHARCPDCGANLAAAAELVGRFEAAAGPRRVALTQGTSHAESVDVAIRVRTEPETLTIEFNARWRDTLRTSDPLQNGPGRRWTLVTLPA